MALCDSLSACLQAGYEKQLLKVGMQGNHGNLPCGQRRRC